MTPEDRIEALEEAFLKIKKEVDEQTYITNKILLCLRGMLQDLKDVK